MERSWPAVRLGGLVGLEAAAVVVLHRLGALPWLQVDLADLPGWLVSAAPEDAVAAVLRLTALACAWWLLASTVAYALACASGLPAATRAIGWATLPVVRRAGERAAMLMLATSSLVTGGAALAVDHGDRPRGPGACQAHDDAQQRTGGEVVVPPGAPWAAGTGAEAAGRWGAARPEPGLGAGEHEVVAGENLWLVARRALTAARGADEATLADRDVHAYWVQVVAANRERLRSGDPDLIHPGERLALPAPQVGEPSRFSSPARRE